METITSKYFSEVVYRNFSEAYVIFSNSYIHCVWLTGGWLIREDREGDVKIRIVDKATPNFINELKGENKEKAVTSFFKPTFYGVRNAERKIFQRSATFKRWYNGVIKKFVRLLFDKSPDVDELRKVMEQMITCIELSRQVG